MEKKTSTAATKFPLISQLPSPYHDRLLQINVVQQLTGAGRQTIYRWMDSGAFPLAVRVHGKRIAWKESEINAWIDSRPRADLPSAKEAK
ncbi:helix-turn-helix transcriptional regulator [Comamonas sp. 4034]|uniref:helix-turn-helix transcriptional regulator n=1 Tax=Comamonas sp. 4034 TaxID=3156455 RepID=UPI003D1ED2EB